MSMQRLSRRTFFRAVIAGVATTSIVGCGAAAPALKVAAKKTVEVLKQVPWDKVSTVVVNTFTGIAVLIGLMNGEEVEIEVKLTAEQLERIKTGETVVVEIKDGSKESLKPKLQSE